MAKTSESPVTVRRLARAEGLTSATVIRAVRQTLADRPVAQLNVAIVNDAQMARLHEEYMGDNSPTDVLTFDLREGSGDEAIEGEIVVSVDTARREADRRGLPPVEELTRYVIHGVLHLLGMDDGTPQERQRMRREETRILKLLASGDGPASVNTGSRKRPVAKGKRVNKRGPGRSIRASERKTR